MAVHLLKPQDLYRSRSFMLTPFMGDTGTEIVMQMLGTTVTTRDLPQTYDLLKHQFPAVLSTKCFNEAHLPFYQEVRNTEIGHLLEHVLLEHLYQEKSSQGHKNVVFNGRTFWDWHKDPIGSFRIMIDVGLPDLSIFKSCLKRAIDLTERVLQSNRTITPQNYLHSHQFPSAR